MERIKFAFLRIQVYAPLENSTLRRKNKKTHFRMFKFDQKSLVCATENSSLHQKNQVYVCENLSLHRKNQAYVSENSSLFERIKFVVYENQLSIVRIKLL